VLTLCLLTFQGLQRHQRALIGPPGYIARQISALRDDSPHVTIKHSLTLSDTVWQPSAGTIANALAVT